MSRISPALTASPAVAGIGGMLATCFGWDVATGGLFEVSHSAILSTSAAGVTMSASAPTRNNGTLIPLQTSLPGMPSAPIPLDKMPRKTCVCDCSLYLTCSFRVSSSVPRPTMRETPGLCMPPRRSQILKASKRSGGILATRRTSRCCWGVRSPPRGQMAIVPAIEFWRWCDNGEDEDARSALTEHPMLCPTKMTFWLLSALR